MMRCAFLRPHAILNRRMPNINKHSMIFANRATATGRDTEHIREAEPTTAVALPVIYVRRLFVRIVAVNVWAVTVVPAVEFTENVNG